MIIKKAGFLSGAIVLLMFFGSCVSGAGSRKEAPYVYLTDTSRYTLLPTSGIEKPLDMAQYVSAAFQGRNFLMISWVKADETIIEMTLLNEMGINVGELSYRDGIMAFSSQALAGLLKPEYIIADFQLCFYNTGLLGRALKDCGLILETSGTARRILRGKDLIYEIEIGSEMVKLTNYLRGYSYTLEGDFS